MKRSTSPSITCGKCEGSLSYHLFDFYSWFLCEGHTASVSVFELKCMTAGTEEAAVKNVVVNCKHIRPQVFAYSGLSVTHAFAGFQLWLFH